MQTLLRRSVHTLGSFMLLVWQLCHHKPRYSWCANTHLE
jgi:hypothetical protein